MQQTISHQVIKNICFAAMLLCLLINCHFALAATPEQEAFFEKKIRPVLVERCYKCHSADAKKSQGGLLVDSRHAMRKGGDTGPAVIPGDVDESVLLQAIRYESYEMPPEGKLSQETIADFEEWVKLGAVDPREAEIQELPGRKIDLEEGRKFWSFQPPKSSDAPKVIQRDWPKRKIDSYILSQLEKANQTPNAAAEKRTLIRRVTFDLIGLPPTPEQVEAFVKDDSPSAYEQLVERLLESPQYGERWTRLWLAVARYAEDQAHIVGNNNSLTYPNAYLYRDWVIEAFNQDIPYDEFVRLQLAGDLIVPEEKETHAALGFLGLGPKYYRRNSLEVMADEWEDRIDTVGRGLLGLTLACARCHDHKYDPIPTEDYYAMAGVFAGTEMYNRPLPKALTEEEKQNEKNEAKKDDNKNDKKNAQKKKKPNGPENTMHIVKEGQPKDINIFIRGDVKAKGPLVKRHFVQVLSKNEPIPLQEGSGRLPLANAIVDRDNPLTARVIVNRIWAAYFGKGLVSTRSNFGMNGELPTHPALLDDLAVRFMENGWSLKWLHREIVFSATYQQSSSATKQQLATDPENLLYGRMNRRRMSVEAWRDALLSASGTLDSTIGGKSIDPANPEQTRRTLYSRISRLELNKMLVLFDYPDPNAHSASRVQTTTPLQKMFVLNSPFMVKQAEAFVERLTKHADNNPARIDFAYQLLFARSPHEQELQLALTYLDQMPEEREHNQEEDTDKRWFQYAQVLLATNEMFFLD